MNDVALRPQDLTQYIGQEQIKNRLKKHLGAIANRRVSNPNEALEHVLVSGPAGLGKTSLAHVIAKELGVELRIMQATAIEKTGDLIANIVTINDGDIFLLDEIHALKPHIEETLYSVMEDFRLDITMPSDGQPQGEPMNIKLPRFCLVGATTKAGHLSRPLQDRFTHKFTMQRYTNSDIETILALSADRLNKRITSDACTILATASRGTPRVANNLLKAARNYADFEAVDEVTARIASSVLIDHEISAEGLTKQDIEYLRVLADNTKAVGVKTLAATLSTDIRTVEENIEAYLLEYGYIMKTASGRVLSSKGEALTGQI